MARFLWGECSAIEMSSPGALMPGDSTTLDKMLDLYKAVAERETGFWLDLPVATGQLVARKEWLRMAESDPEHFQLASITADGLTSYSTTDEDGIERAVFVRWSDEQLQ